MSTIVKPGDEIRLLYRERPSPGVAPEEFSIEVVYEDDQLIVLNKPAGMVVHPTKNYQNHTLANGLAYHFLRQGLTIPIRPLHRLDKDTSGLVVFAKNPIADDALTRQLMNGKLKRKYLAIVWGVLDKQQDTIDLPIQRLSDHPTQRAVRPSGQRAVTHYRVIKRWPSATMLELSLETGRTHQIRTHLAHIGHPLIGDSLYGGESFAGFKRQALHAAKVTFMHPLTAKQVSLSVPMPQDMVDLIKKLESSSPSVTPVHQPGTIRQ
jgi:RluA family pseudouridine synthase